MLVEVIGYMGSALIVVAMLMSSVVKLRVINSIGAGIFVIYALMIKSYPTALMNICLIIINIYNLLKLKKQDKHFDLVNGASNDTFLRYILNYYKEDIKTYFPNWDINLKGMDTAYIVCCDAVPAGVLLGKIQNEGTLEISIDYSIPTYRDCSVGKYLYSKLPAQGIHKLVFCGNFEKHEGYLKKMEFHKENDVYTKNLDKED